MDLASVLMDRTHDPSKQSKEDKAELLQYRQDLMNDLDFGRAPAWNAVQRRAAILEAEQRTAYRAAQAKNAASNQLAEHQRRAATEAGVNRKAAKGAKTKRPDREGGGRGGGDKRGEARGVAAADRADRS